MHTPSEQSWDREIQKRESRLRQKDKKKRRFAQDKKIKKGKSRLRQKDKKGKVDPDKKI